MRRKLRPAAPSIDILSNGPVKSADEITQRYTLLVVNLITKWSRRTMAERPSGVAVSSEIIHFELQLLRWWLAEERFVIECLLLVETWQRAFEVDCFTSFDSFLSRISAS